MKLKKYASFRTLRRYVERHEGYPHDCITIGCTILKKGEKGCGMWFKPFTKRSD